MIAIEALRKCWSFTLPVATRAEGSSSDVATQALQNPDPSRTQQIDQGPSYSDKLLERWRKLPRTIIEYPSGVYPDGTKYELGRRLIINGEQVMNTFEEPWCMATVETMFEDKRGPLIVVERGYGLGIMADYILQKMLSHGGEYHIIELNQEVFKDARNWANAQQRSIDRMQLPFPLKISVHLGDADEVLRSFQSGSFDLIFSDTHQLEPDKRGVNDILDLDQLKRRLKPSGRFTFCAFHRDNQEGGLDERQVVLLTTHFNKYQVVSGVEVVPPIDCSYLRGPVGRLPVVVCEKPQVKTT